VVEEEEDEDEDDDHDEMGFDVMVSFAYRIVCVNVMTIITGKK
jgi:hypothetical protein